MKRSKLSTSTVLGSEYLVPWLAAEGPLSYCPEEPPARDYFFQYSWIMPGIFSPKVNLRDHFYFGHYNKEESDFLFQFWEKARRGHAPQKYSKLGLFWKDEVKAPIAVYNHIVEPGEKWGSLLIQHGSYQWVTLRDQPLIERGRVHLYRGIGRKLIFRSLWFEPEKLSPAQREIWRSYLALQAKMLSDSVLSFNTIHDRTKRCETSCLRDGTWLGDEMAVQAGLNIKSRGFAKDLWAAAHQSYSLEPWVAQNKFGPHYVVFETPLSNIRITTFFAGEGEVKVIDPTLLKIVEAAGCRVEPSIPHD